MARQLMIALNAWLEVRIQRPEPADTSVQLRRPLLAINPTCEHAGNHFRFFLITYRLLE